MKSAMQEFIGEAEKMAKMEGDAGLVGRSILTMVKKLNSLKKNKEEIIDAYWGGLNGSMNDWSEAKTAGSEIRGIKAGKGAEQYFREKFNIQQKMTKNDS